MKREDFESIEYYLLMARDLLSEKSFDNSLDKEWRKTDIKEIERLLREICKIIVDLQDKERE